MLTLTPELEAILKDYFQAGASGFRGRFEVATRIPAVAPGDPSIVQIGYQGNHSASFPVNVTPGNTVIAIQGQRSPTGIVAGLPGFIQVAQASGPIFGGADNRGIAIAYYPVPVSPPYGNVFTSTPGDTQLIIIELVGEWVPDTGSIVTRIADTDSVMDCGGPITPPAGDPIFIAGGAVYGPKSYVGYPNVTEDADSIAIADAGNGPHTWAGYRIVSGPSGSYTLGGTLPGAYTQNGLTVAFVRGEGEGGGGSPASEFWTAYYGIESINIDKSLRMTADEATVLLTNEIAGSALGWGEQSVFKTNQRCRIFQWYGDEANAVQTFEGIIDRVHDHRDVPDTQLTMRDMMGILLDETFSAIGPQGSTEDGAIRTEENGVYLNREVSYIVTDLLDRAGFPADDRVITDTSYVLDEFIVDDGASVAETIIGKERLTGYVGYEAWCDEMGVFHFSPVTASTAEDTDTPQEVQYVFRSGEDVMALDDETAQDALRTRVKVRGPYTTTTLKDAWTELWRTTKIRYPVGIWYDPTAPTYIRVLDRVTKKMYKLRQSDRVILSSVYLGGVVSHPLGLSGDPADSSIYWVLHAPWRDGVSGTNKVKKIRKSDNVVLASYDLPSGNWSAIKVSANYVWLTNLSTDRFYKRSKTDLSGINSYQHTYNGDLQANPSGIMIDGTTLHLFWSNGGTTARFLVCDEATPTVIDKVVRTAGVSLHGGEMDTTTHTECWGDSDSLGLVAKFTLVEPVSTTTDVATEVINSDLEDELGELALLEDRVHDAHSGDDPHPFEVRRETINLDAISSLSQATDTARRILETLDQRGRILDVGIVGNPALQKVDLVGVVDPVAGLNEAFRIDTYRSTMDAAGNYVGTLALLPVGSIALDDVEDEGDASE